MGCRSRPGSAKIGVNQIRLAIPIHVRANDSRRPVSGLDHARLLKLLCRCSHHKRAQRTQSNRLKQTSDRHLERSSRSQGPPSLNRRSWQKGEGGAKWQETRLIPSLDSTCSHAKFLESKAAFPKRVIALPKGPRIPQNSRNGKRIQTPASNASLESLLQLRPPQCGRMLVSARRDPDPIDAVITGP